MIQVYTGNGKGKTTAALGLALRASGAGLKVYIGQFVKCGCYSEIKALKALKNIKVEQFGAGCFIKRIPVKDDLLRAKSGLEKAKKAIAAKKYDLVILDEINVAVKLRLVELSDVISLIKNTHPRIELVLTGRHAHPEIIRLADLVSQIQDLKHYYCRGLKARKGIEL